MLCVWGGVACVYLLHHLVHHALGFLQAVALARQGLQVLILLPPRRAAQ